MSHHTEEECPHKKHKHEETARTNEQCGEDCKHDRSTESEDDSWEFSYKNPDLLPWEVRGAHPLLEKYLEEITGGRSGLKILVPLCGRSDDMPWLANLGHKVYGVEYDAEGCEGFFKVHGLEFTHSDLGSEGNAVYKANSKEITLYQCNFFHLLDLEPSLLASIDVIWDRAAIRTTVEVEDPNEGIKAYIGTMLKLLATGGKFAMENTRFDAQRYPEMAQMSAQVSDDMITELCAEKWEVKKLGDMKLKAGEALEPVFKEMEHDIVVHLLTPK